MSSLVLAETCPPPECNLSPRDVEGLVDELRLYHARFGPAFLRPEQLYWSGIYLNGLLGDEPRKSIEPIALQAGVNVRDPGSSPGQALQYFIGQSPWRIESVPGSGPGQALRIHQQMIDETLGEDDAVAIIDESGMVKQGEDSVGVGHQYCGSVGKTANCQSLPRTRSGVGVYLGYASRLGYTLAEGRLYMPKSWFDPEQAQRREKCGVPEELTFKACPGSRIWSGTGSDPGTKPQIAPGSGPGQALEILQDTVQRGALRFQWVTADEVYGDTPQFLDGVANPGSSPGQALGKWYFAEVACSTQVWRRRPAVVKPWWSGQGKRPKMRLRTPSHRPVQSLP